MIRTRWLGLSSVFLCSAILVLVTTGPTQAADPVPVTACGQEIASGTAGELSGDLDCSGTGFSAVVVQDGGTLYLNGHTLTGSTAGNAYTVHCIAKCRVVGAGTIAGGSAGIASLEIPGKVDIRDVVIRDAAGSGVLGGTVRIRDSEIRDNGQVSEGCGVFVGSRSLKIVDTTVTGNSCGVFNHGSKPAVILRSNIIDNVSTHPDPRFIAGVIGLAGVKAKDSTITGHLVGIPPKGTRCDSWGCGDIITFEVPPKLVGVTCGNSADMGELPVVAWNVCANDADFDQDGTPNAADGCDVDPTCALEDGDGDGVAECCDNCPLAANPDRGDWDNDGDGDACDADIDGDGSLNDDDLCDFYSNCTVQDADGDLVGDCCDNCPDDANPGQEDGDTDSIGDVCDPTP
jgi:hypothetical protein